MTGETPWVRSGKKEKKKKEKKKRKEKRKGRKRRKIMKNHGTSWNIMDHHGIEN